ncbi:hypothetical protein J6590_055876 [Homalodisca vitripennis]|nr:hypothetical protein J6590_055876 [Homalodisca vitripennis]
MIRELTAVTRCTGTLAADSPRFYLSLPVERQRPHLTEVTKYYTQAVDRGLVSRFSPPQALLSLFDSSISTFWSTQCLVLIH